MSQVLEDGTGGNRNKTRKKNELVLNLSTEPLITFNEKKNLSVIAFKIEIRTDIYSSLYFYRFQYKYIKH